ncbi:hypothetical protein Taro_032795 [Colocasia esculenta]|uniref:Uncharacterized protein n=1 Tax=Colocasia esculenta TaxID=4460 RepID=A0A843W757_COLES|nr:hypothetical protein [Colocasia esculenta]
MQTQAHTQAALQAQLEAQQTQAQVPVPQAQDHGGPSIMERFKRMSPPSFKGESDPLLAESWMREIEKIFRAIRCADDDRVTLATYMLQVLRLLLPRRLLGVTRSESSVPWWIDIVLHFISAPEPSPTSGEMRRRRVTRRFLGAMENEMHVVEKNLEEEKDWRNKRQEELDSGFLPPGEGLGLREGGEHLSEEGERV